MTEKEEEKPKDPYQKYKDFKWEKPDELRNGPIADENRKCRDCICCIIFILIFILCIVVAVFGFWKGKPTQLFYLYDEDGKACGHDEGYEDYPYLYFYNIISGAVNGVANLDYEQVMRGVCVSKCPNVVIKIESVDDWNDKYVDLDCKKTTNNQNCKVKYKDYYESKELIEKLLKIMERKIMIIKICKNIG